MPSDPNTDKEFQSRSLFSLPGDPEAKPSPGMRRRRRISDSELRRIYNAISEQPLPAEFDELLRRIDQNR